MGRGIIIALALSLGANVFLGGFVAGRVGAPNIPGFDRGRGPDDGGPDDGGPDGYGHDGGGQNGGEKSGRHKEFETLPPAVRERLRAAFKSNREDFIATFSEGRLLHQEFISTLTAEEFDRAGAEAVAQKLEAFEGERRRTMPRLIIDVMDGLAVEDRRALASVVERRLLDEAGGSGRPHRRFRERGRRQDSAPPPPPESEADSPPTE